MTQSNQSHQLGVLIAAPQPDEAAMYNDMTAMVRSLQGRGYSADQILCLHGRIDRRLALAYLQAASRRVALWTHGSVFLHVSSHGFFDGEAVEDARPGLLFGDAGDVTDDYHLFWDDFFAALALPAGVRLTLLPDL